MHLCLRWYTKNIKTSKIGRHAGYLLELQGEFNSTSGLGRVTKDNGGVCSSGLAIATRYLNKAFSLIVAV